MTDQDEILEEMTYAVTAVHRHYCTGLSKEGIDELRLVLSPFCRHIYKDVGFKENINKTFHKTINDPILSWEEFQIDKVEEI